MRNLSRNQKLLFAIISFALLVAIIAATTFILSVSLSKKSSTVAIIPISAQKIVQSYRETYAVSNLEKKYVEQKDSLASSMIDYRSDSTPYNIRLFTSNTVTYSTTDTANNGADTLVSDAAAFLATQSLTTGPTTTDDTSSRTLYDGTLSVCQVITVKAFTDKIADHPATFGIGCTAKENIATEYRDIDALLVLYQKTNTLPDLTQVTRSLAIDKATPITILYVTVADAASANFRAYFVTTNGQPTFIGTQSIPAVGTDQTVVQSDELTKALIDPVYGAFLTETIEKY